MSICFADIIETAEFEVLQSKVYEADRDTLVIFDIDEVIITGTDDFTRAHPVRMKLVKEIQARYSKEEVEDMFGEYTSKAKVKLVDPRFPGLLEYVWEKKIPTIALTACMTGKCGKIPKCEDLRLKELMQFGISFAKMSPLKKEESFPELKARSGIPMVKAGVILTASYDKGSVLKIVLEKEKLWFKKIIFIDNLLKNLESVRIICEELGCIFQGIYYTAAKLIPLPKLDEEKERLRFEILKKECIWLLDRELENRFKELNN